MADDKIIERAQSLAALVENEFYNEAWEAVHASYVDAIVRSKADDVQLREEMKRRIDLLANVRQKIEGAIANGQIEANKRGWASLFTR